MIYKTKIGFTKNMLRIFYPRFIQIFKNSIDIKLGYAYKRSVVLQIYNFDNLIFIYNNIYYNIPLFNLS